jgi:UDP-GlcNAc:undecaprenyl-phosphate GlcNAc-1-phosphate transferase
MVKKGISALTGRDLNESFRLFFRPDDVVGLKVNPVGFVDDDHLKKGKKIQGYPILGVFNEIETILSYQPVSGILISFNDLNDKNSDAYRDAKKLCLAKNLYLRKFRIDLLDVDLV